MFKSSSGQHPPACDTGITYDAAETKTPTANIIWASLALLLSLGMSCLAILFAPSHTYFGLLVVVLPVLISVRMFRSLLLLIPRSNVRKDTFRQLRRAAKKGDPTAWMELGKCYLDGFGVSRNLEKAADCFKTAANLNQPDAQVLLAYCYHIGTGVRRDEALVLSLRDVGDWKESQIECRKNMQPITTDESLAAAFARCHLTAGKPFTVREAALGSCRPPTPTQRFWRHGFAPTWDSPTCETGHPDAENYLIFSDNSIYVGVGFGLPAAPHTLSSLAAAVEARRKDGSPLPPALRELLIHIVSNEQGGWEEAETDTALLLLAAADRDARLRKTGHA